jgi:hypothetical protein
LEVDKMQDSELEVKRLKIVKELNDQRASKKLEALGGARALNISGWGNPPA